jgi:hypothetical protein
MLRSIGKKQLLSLLRVMPFLCVCEKRGAESWGDEHCAEKIALGTIWAPNFGVSYKAFYTYREREGLQPVLDHDYFCTVTVFQLYILKNVITYGLEITCTHVGREFLRSNVAGSGEKSHQY